MSFLPVEFAAGVGKTAPRLSFCHVNFAWTGIFYSVKRLATVVNNGGGLRLTVNNRLPAVDQLLRVHVKDANFRIGAVPVR